MPDFVPVDFQPPSGLDRPRFRLRPLGTEHNESDHAAWMSSIDHIHRTPGFEGSNWPNPMSLEENRTDLERHAADFSARLGFTYTVLAPADATVIGCVYIYPSEDAARDAVVRSWVRAADADLDAVLWREVSRWLEASWPFQRADYAPRA
jgi:RimJ/RimL family protein N-acetyltransferase